MADLYFALRMLALTVIIAIAMQVKVGPATVEQHSLAWIQGSSLAAGLRTVSDGAIKATSRAFHWVAGSIDARFNRIFRHDEAAGVRTLGVKLDRSDAVKKAHAERKRASDAAAEDDEVN